MLVPSEPTSSNAGGRPTKPFQDGGDRAQRYKIKQLQAEHSQELINAAAISEKNQQVFDLDYALSLMTQADFIKISVRGKEEGHQRYGPQYFSEL